NRQVTEALEQQTATAEVLRVIASSPTDLQGMLNVIAESAARFCGASSAVIHQVQGDVLVRAGRWGGPLGGQVAEVLPLSADLINGRAVLTNQPVHVYGEPDDIRNEYPLAADLWRRGGMRAYLCMPLVREGKAMGTIALRRVEPVPFSDKQIDSLRT